jgi:hypothetical protein
MSNVNKLIKIVEDLTVKLDELSIRIEAGFENLESLNFKLESPNGFCESELNFDGVVNEYKTIRSRELTSEEWLDNATLHAYEKNLIHFNNHYDIFYKIITARNEGYSMEQIFDNNKSKMPCDGISGLYNCINSARRNNYISIEDSKYKIRRNNSISTVENYISTEENKRKMRSDCDRYSY